MGEFFAHPDASALLAEYAAESAMAELPSPEPHAETYARLEQAGALRLLVATDGDALLGFLVLLVTLNPHYSIPIGVVESYFVAAAHRKEGAGLALLHRAGEIAKDAGALALLVSAPTGSRLADVLAASKSYRESNRVFLRSLA